VGSRVAFFDPAAAAIATAAGGGLATAFVRRTRGIPRLLLSCLIGLCVLNLVILSFHFGLWSLEPLRGSIAAGAIGIILHVSIFYLHLPSITLLGVDENLERHGSLTTALAQFGDLVLIATALALIIHWRRLRTTSVLA